MLYILDLIISQADNWSIPTSYYEVIQDFCVPKGLRAKESWLPCLALDLDLFIENTSKK